MIKRRLTKLHIPKLIEAHQDALNKPFIIDEVKIAAFQIGPFKAPRIDGKLGIFYQHYWNIVGDLTTASTLFCPYSRYLLKELNKTLIVLIPKMANPNRASHYRPISLCNVVYKIIFKTIVNRL